MYTDTALFSIVSGRQKLDQRIQDGVSSVPLGSERNLFAAANPEG
jgi:hypothetical protein